MWFAEFTGKVTVIQRVYSPPYPSTQFTWFLVNALGYWQALESSQTLALSPFDRISILPDFM